MLVKHQVAIINRVITKLCANIANNAPWQTLMRLTITDRHDKRLHAVILPLRDASSVQKHMVCLPGQISWPELGRLERWGVNNELIRIFVISGCGFQASYI